MIQISKATVSILTLSVAALVYACSVNTTAGGMTPNGDGAILPDGTAFSRSALLIEFGQCILSEIEAFQAQTAVYAEVANQALAEPTDVQLSDVQDAWQDTIDIWQRLEMMQVGPAGRKTVPGGQDIRASIYPYPSTDFCEIDQHLTRGLNANNGSEIGVEAKGLRAAEYLLFATGEDNSCDATHELNTDGSWDALDETTKTTRRATYAAITGNAVNEAANNLLEAWSPNGENFLAELTQGGSGSRTFGKKRVALNAVSDALGYLEWGVKDQKLARPLGIIGCSQSDCSALVEAKYSQRSKLHLVHNMIGFQKIFKGCGPDFEGLGFDDYLYAIGSTQLADQITRAIQGVLNALDAIEERDLVSALRNDSDSVYALHNAVSALSRLMRNDFLIALNLELPQMVQGDND